MLGILATPGRLAFGAGVLAVSVAGVAGLASSALFTDTKSAGADSFITGTVAISPNSTSTSPISLSNMAAGDSASRNLVVENTGSLELKYTVASAATGDSGLGTALTAVLRTGTCSGSGTELYNGSFSGVSAASRTLAATAKDNLCLTVSLASSATNTVAGKTAGNNLAFSAVQTANNP
ncbi:MAG: TasA family protein [Actinomycetes bacterium]